MEKGIRFSIIFLIIGCATGTRYPPQKIDADPVQESEIRDKYNLYYEMSKSHLIDQWLPDTKCDGLLFNSLYAIMNKEVDPIRTESDRYPGKFYRSPEHDCFEKALSRSECSRDMYIGLMLWIYHQRDLAAIERIIAWGEKNSNKLLAQTVWIMCAGQPGAIEFRPDLIETAKLLRYNLGGRRYHSILPMPLADCSGYECHIRSLHLLIRAKVRGWVSEPELRYLQKQADRNDKNAFFGILYARYSGDQIYKDRAGKMLLKERYFPSGRLPTSEDRCGFYLWERDQEGSSWQPCPNEGKIHSALDFLIAAAMYLDEI